MKRYSIIIYAMCSLVLFSCKKELSTPNDAPPQIGFAQNEAIVDVQDGAQLELFLSKPAPVAIVVHYEISGSARPGEDFVIEDMGSIRIEAGMMEGIIDIRVTDQTAEAANEGREFTIRLLPGEGYNVSAPLSEVLMLIALQHTINITIWAKEVVNPQLWGYDNAPDQNTGPGNGRHFAFCHASNRMQNTVGFFSKSNPNASANIFNMHRLYVDENVTSGSANIVIPEAFRFIPDFEGATEGNVEVIEQQVKVTRTASSGRPPFFIGIKGGGRYSETEERIEIEVIFDESELGGPAEISRFYRYQPNED